MRFVIMDEDTRELLLDATMEYYRVREAKHNAGDEVWVYVQKRDNREARNEDL